MRPWPSAVTGNTTGTGADGLIAPAPLVCWVMPASNVGPRGFNPEVLDMGLARWVNERVVPALTGRGFTHVIIAYPGGQEDRADLRFDMISRAADHPDPKVQACGDYAAWSEVATTIKERLNVRVGFYLGTAACLSRPATLGECETVIMHWAGVVDFVAIDCLGVAKLGSSDTLAADRLASAGFDVWGEPRPTRGNVLLPIPYLCFLSKWEQTGGVLGNADHTPLDVVQAQGAGVIVFDETGRIHPTVIEANRNRGIGVCIGMPQPANVGGVE